MRFAGVAVLLLLASAAVARAQAPAVFNGGVVDAASGRAGVAPGSLVSIFGSALASSTAAADSIPLSTRLSDVSVTFNNIPAPLLFTSSGQVNAQLPWNVLPPGSTSGSVNVVVTRGGTPSAPSSFLVAPFSPAVYALPSGQGVAVNSDGSIAGPSGSIPGLNVRPAKIGDPGGLVIYASGLGAVDSSIANGADSHEKLRSAVTPPAVLIGGVAAKVVFAGLAPQFVGVYQVNVAIPDATPTGNTVPLQLQVGGMTSSDKVTIAVGK